MSLAKNESEFTKLRIKKATIKKLNKVKAAQEVKDGEPHYLYEIIDELADKELIKKSKNGANKNS